jgi:hypothetical protein
MRCVHLFHGRWTRLSVAAGALATVVGMAVASMVSLVQVAVVSFSTGHLKDKLVKVLGIAIALIGGSTQAAVLWSTRYPSRRYDWHCRWSRSKCNRR